VRAGAGSAEGWRAWPSAAGLAFLLRLAYIVAAGGKARFQGLLASQAASVSGSGNRRGDPGSRSPRHSRKVLGTSIHWPRTHGRIVAGAAPLFEHERSEGSVTLALVPAGSWSPAPVSRAALLLKFLQAPRQAVEHLPRLVQHQWPSWPSERPAVETYTLRGLSRPGKVGRISGAFAGT